MTLRNLLSDTIQRLTTDISDSPFKFYIGFVTSENIPERWSIRRTVNQYELVEGIKDAPLVFLAPLDTFKELLAATDGDTPDRTNIILPPNYMGSISQISVEVFGIKIDLKSLPQQREFSMPLRYPVAENTFLTPQYPHWFGNPTTLSMP